MTAHKKIPRPVFRYVEFELYNLGFNKKELNRIKEEIIFKSPDRFQGGKTTGISDQTGNKAVRLVSDMRIFHLERSIEAIEEALKNPLFEELYELKYKKQLPWQEVIDRMSISKRTYYRIREGLIADIAKKIGLL